MEIPHVIEQEQPMLLVPNRSSQNSSDISIKTEEISAEIITNEQLYELGGKFKNGEYGKMMLRLKTNLNNQKNHQKNSFNDYLGGDDRAIIEEEAENDE